MTRYDRPLPPNALPPRRVRAWVARLLTALLLTTAIGLLLAAQPQLATADTAPPDASLPTTVSTDPLPTAQHNGVVWSQVVVGNTVYAAGEFTRARPAGTAKGSSAEVVRSHLLAYNITTGALTSFAPSINGKVKDIAAAPDGSAIYIGGVFTTVNGVTRNRLAAFNTSTGALLTGFAPNINHTVNGVTVSAGTVYFGGSFTAVNGTSRINAGAVDRLTGATRPFNANMTATAGRSVQQVTVSPQGDKVVIGGNFETVNGSANPGYGLALLDATSGALLPMPVNNLIRNGQDRAGITGLEATSEGFYGTGYAYSKTQGNLEGTFRADWNGNLVWVEDCHGDSYSVFPAGNDVYVAGHPHYCGNVAGFPQTEPNWTFQRAVAFSNDVRGTISREPLGYFNYEGKPRPALLTWFPDINAGTYTGQSQGPWSVSGNSDYIVYGGEFTSVNNKAQEGLVRFARNPAAHADGPRLGAANYLPTATSFAQGIRLSWPANHDRDNELLTYRLIRDGATASPIFTTTARSTFWQRPYLGYLDTGVAPGSTHTYRVRVTDPKGNVVDGGTISATASGGQSLSAYDVAALRDGPQSYWSFNETSGTTAADVSSNFNGTQGSGVSSAPDGISGSAYRFNGTSSGTVAATTATARVAPQIFSIETWFRTTSSSGGKLIGFGNAASGNSTAYDRHIYLSNSGTLTFGVNNAGQRTLSSPGPTTYRDGKWHHVVGTLSPAGMSLYVDGALVASRTDAVYAQIINSGYWRIGGDNTANWAGAGASGYLNGDLDNVAVYHHPLTSAQIRAHYDARTGTTPNQPPTAAFTSTSSGLTASFNASGSSDSDGQIASYAWNFGDGTTGTGVSPSHAYSTAGTRNVTLTVTDDDGGTGTVTRSVTVSVPPPGNDPPTASFTSNCTDLSCAFNATASSDPDGSISSYAWDFGDGTTGTGATVTHPYTAAGTYPVTLTVTDNSGATDSDTASVSPTAAPAGSAFAVDDFERTVASGFGSADTGGAWTTSPAASHSVSGGTGRMSISSAGVNRTAYLGSATATSTDVTMSMTLDKVPTATLYLEVTGRRVGTNLEYDGLVKITSSGAIQAGLRRYTSASAADVTAAVGTGFTYTAGSTLNVRLQVIGTSPTTLQMKVWPASGSEPANWQVTGTDSTASLQAAGAPGVRSYQGGTPTNLPILWQVDNLVARPVQ